MKVFHVIESENIISKRAKSHFQADSLYKFCNVSEACETPFVLHVQNLVTFRNVF